MKNSKGTYRDCRKSTGNKLGLICITLCTCAIAVLHEQWMCLGIQRNTHITGNNLIPISVPIHFVDGQFYMYNYIGVCSSGV